MSLVAGLFLALSPTAATPCECLPEKWKVTVERSEALVVRRKVFVVPNGPVGAYPGPSCVRIAFQISDGGEPTNIRIDQSSRNRVVDVAATSTLKHFRFKTPKGLTSGEVFALVFWYEPE
jgi:TonB family protein